MKKSTLSSGKLFSSDIFQYLDEVEVIALKVGEKINNQFNILSNNPFVIRNQLNLMVKYLKQNYDKEGHQVYIKTKQEQTWIPVDHFYWKDDRNKVSRVDFTSTRQYVEMTNKSVEYFRKKEDAIKRLANMIWKKT